MEFLVGGTQTNAVVISTMLRDWEVFNNSGAFLCVANNGGNVATTMKAIEYMLEDLTGGNYAGTENTEPAA